MKYVNRDLKGTFGYIKKQFIFEIIKTVILYLMAFGIFFIGYFSLGTKKSLWSVFAVLALLPACKSLVGVIMLGRYKSLKDDVYNKYITSAGDVECIYENIITTSQKTFFLPVIACEDNTVVGYINTNKASDVKDVTEHLSNVLKNAGHKVATIKIFDNEEAYINRVKQMNNNLAKERLASTQEIFTTIKAVSL